MSEEKRTIMMESETPKTAEELLVQMYLKLQLENESLKQQLNRRGAALEKVCEEFAELKKVLKDYGYYDEHGETKSVNIYLCYYDWQSDKEEVKRNYDILKKYTCMSDSMKEALEAEAAAEAKTSDDDTDTESEEK